MIPVQISLSNKNKDKFKVIISRTGFSDFEYSRKASSGSQAKNNARFAYARKQLKLTVKEAKTPEGRGRIRVYLDNYGSSFKYKVINLSEQKRKEKEHAEKVESYRKAKYGE